MISRTLAAIALVCCSTAFAATPAATAMANTQYNADTKKAAQQYEADKKVCADERDANARLQCRRDAKAVNDLALRNAQANVNAAAATVTPAPPLATTTAPAPTPIPASVAWETAPPACTDCGTVTAVSVLEKQGKGTTLGLIAGGVGGAILGHQVGDGVGKDLATLAGAVGGAFTGDKVEEKARSSKAWTVTVQYPDYSKRTFEFKEDPKYKAGDQVKNAGASITRR